MRTVKEMDARLNEELLSGLIGTVVHAKTNELLDKEGNVHNVWFAGMVAGYQKSVIAFDYVEDKPLDEPKVQLQILLTDGMAYGLSETALEINELTDDEFLALVEEYTASEIANEILLPTKEKKIILPGRDY